MSLTKAERELMRKLASRGGKKAARNMTAAQRRERAAKAGAAPKKRKGKQKGK